MVPCGFITRRPVPVSRCWFIPVAAYSATKAGLVSLTREPAKGLAPEVRVNAIAPGFVGDSNWDIDWGEGWKERESAKVPLGRVGRVEDYADAIFYLCAGAAYITGQTLVVDGGLTA